MASGRRVSAAGDPLESEAEDVGHTLKTAAQGQRPRKAKQQE